MLAWSRRFQRKHHENGKNANSTYISSLNYCDIRVLSSKCLEVHHAFDCQPDMFSLPFLHSPK